MSEDELERHPNEEWDEKQQRWIKRRAPGGGRKRKDTAHHERMGNYRPSRHGEREIGDAKTVQTLKPYEAPEAPLHLSEGVVDVWVQLCAELKPKRLPKTRDVIVFEILCVAIFEYRRIQKMLDNPKYHEPTIERQRLLTEQKKRSEEVAKFGPRFGLDPVSARDVHKRGLGAGRVAAEAAEQPNTPAKDGNPSPDSGGDGPNILSFVAGA